MPRVSKYSDKYKFHTYHSSKFSNLFIYYFSLSYPGGGISSYAGNKGGAASSLDECMDKAMQEIPKSRHKLTPVYLGATAGMRLLKWVRNVRNIHWFLLNVYI